MQIKWDLEHVYFYVVSFVALILIIVGAVNITRTVIAYITPTYEDFGPWSPYGPGQDLRNWEEKFGPEFVEQEKVRFDTISKINYRRGLIRDLVGGLSFILVALPVYLYHWRKIPGLEKGNGDEKTGKTEPVNSTG